MQEDSKKKFVLLSKVAKERKYAQEYLSLLARRGDLGSIRIGKRWYTTNEWIGEFFEASQNKKKTAKTEKIFFAPKMETQRIEAKDIGIKIFRPPVAKKQKPVPVFAGQNERKSFIDVYKLNGIRYSPKVAFERREKIIIEAKREQIPIRPIANNWNAFSREREPLQRIRVEAGSRQNVFREAREKKPQQKAAAREEVREQPPFEAVEINTRPGFTSPNFAGSSGLQAVFSFRFAFATALVLLFFLFVSSAFVFRDELKVVILGEREGKVAGAMSDRSDGKQEGSEDGLIQARTAASYYLANTSNRMKENLSFSHVMLKSAVARAANNQQ